MEKSNLDFSMGLLYFENHLHGEDGFMKGIQRK